MSCALLAAAAGAGYASAQQSPGPVQGQNASASEGRAARQQLAVFSSGSASRPSDAVSRDLIRRLPSDLALDPSMTRLAQKNSASAVYVLAGPGSLCVSHMSPDGSSGGIGCTGDPKALVDGSTPFASVDVLDDGYRVTSLLADGATSPSVVTEDGRTKSADIVNNTVVTTVATTPVQFRWVAPDGTQRSVKLDS